MNILQIADELCLEKLSLPMPEAEISGGYVGDLLSWVMGRAECGQIWVTIMTNINILAVASLSGVSGIIVAEGAEVSEEVIDKANEQGINLLRSKSSAFDIVCSIGRELSAQ